MSWMDSASGSSTFHGGGDHAGNNGPSGAGTGGRPGNGGNNYSQTGGLGGGLGTGTTWHGNTAFGPAGGNAVGYVSLKDGGSIFQGQRGMGPSVNTYSNFRNPDGTPMVGGNLQNTSVTARNPQQALGMLHAMQQGQQQGQQGNNVQGLLSNDDVTVGPTNQTTVTSTFNPYNALTTYATPFGPEYFALASQAGLNNFSQNLDAWHNYADDDRGYTTNFQNQTIPGDNSLLKTDREDSVNQARPGPGKGNPPGNLGGRTYGGYY